MRAGFRFIWSAGVAVVHAGSDRPLENKALLIDPQGRLAIEYRRAIPVPGFEARASRAGPRKLPTHDSSHGRLAAAICFDLDFPAYIRQAGRARAALLLVPASDWEAIKSLHFEVRCHTRDRKWRADGLCRPLAAGRAPWTPALAR